MRVQDGLSHWRVHVGVPWESCRHEVGLGALPPCCCPALFLPGLLTVVPPWGCRRAPAPQPVSAALRPGSCLAPSLGLPSVGGVLLSGALAGRPAVGLSGLRGSLVALFEASGLWVALSL